MTKPTAPAGRFVAFGEIMLRLSPPGRELLLQSHRLDVWIAGAEANVAAALAGLGHDAALVSAVPDGALGDAALAFLRGRGVDCAAIRRAPGRMALYWVENGAGLRPPEMLYDRDGSAFQGVPADNWGWDMLLAGAGRLHLSGITPALGPGGTAAALAAVEAAMRAGVPVSFDGNFRARLWQRWDGRPRDTLARLVAGADILFGNHRDIGLLLDRDLPADDPRAAAEAAFAAFPRLMLIATTSRQIRHVDHHRLSARLDTRDATGEAIPLEVPGIVDRVGTGDAFAAGVLHALRTSGDLSMAANAGLALCALKHSIPGDAAPITRHHLELFMAGHLEARR